MQKCYEKLGRMGQEEGGICSDCTGVPPVKREERISQEAGQVVWYFHHLKNFPQFIVIHTVKGFGIVSKAEIDVFSGTRLLFH